MSKRIRNIILSVAAVGAIAVGASAVAGAASEDNSGSSGAAQTLSDRPGPPQQHPGETPLTGDTAAKVRKAAEGKVSGATVTRVETDAEGSPYEAHMRKSDGSEVTVKVNKEFEATEVEEGHGGPPGAGGPNRNGSSQGGGAPGGTGYIQ